MASVSIPLILIADDDSQFLRLMAHHIGTWGYRVSTASDKRELLQAIAIERPSALLMDVRFGEHNGVEILRPLLEEDPNLDVLMLTAHGSIEGAVAAMRIGARDYITKPVDLERLRTTLNHILDDARSPRTPADRPAENRGESSRRLERPILGTSPALIELLETIKLVAATDATVFITGESGTGKELVARAIHELSSRSHGPFIPVNVAALPRELVESTLFGHEKGAFTGAEKSQAGCCEAADKGTLFLDEIAEMEIGLQAKLLRFLQERTVQRVGRSSAIKVDVRIVAATNKDPLQHVKQGLLREDLYYRLNVVPISVPSLRQRRTDIPLLAAHFLEKASSRHGRPGKTFTPEALAALAQHDWPGNVRQLENLVERMAILVNSSEIGDTDVRKHLGISISNTSQCLTDLTPNPNSDSLTSAEPDLSEIEQIERQAIVTSLARAGGNVRDAARLLGLGPATVYRKIKKYKIEN